MQGHDLAMMLRSAYLAMHRRCDAHFARAGVTADQFVVLAALAEEDALTQQALVARTSSDPNTIRAMLVLLERRQLVQRRAHPTDRRARSVTLTSHGRQVYRRLWNGSESLRKQLVAPFSASETAGLLQSLSKIVTSMQATAAEERPPKRLRTAAASR